MYTRQTSRLGKFIVVLLGSIGLMYIGGGHAHADTITVAAAPASNLTSPTDNATVHTATVTSTTVSTSATSSDNNDQLLPPAPSNGNHHLDGSPAIMSPTDQTASTPVSPNSEIDGSNSLSVIVTNLPTNPKDALATTSTSASPFGSSVAAAPAPTSTQVTVNVYATRRAAVGTNANSHTSPIAPAAAPTNPKPTPAMPTGTSMLVSSAASAAPMVKFQAALAGLGATRGRAVTVTLMLLISVSVVFLVSAFMDHLRAMGSVRAPRGATTTFHFAFPISEFGLSLRLKTGSLFSSVLIPALAGGLYEGGRG